MSFFLHCMHIKLAGQAVFVKKNVIDFVATCSCVLGLRVSSLIEFESNPKLTL